MLISLFTLLIALAIIGFLTYLITEYIPMPAPFKQVIIVVMVLAIVFFLLTHFSSSLARFP